MCDWIVVEAEDVGPKPRDESEPRDEHAGQAAAPTMSPAPLFRAVMRRVAPSPK